MKNVNSNFPTLYLASVVEQFKNHTINLHTKSKKAHLFFTFNTFLLSVAVLLVSTTEINVLQTVFLANITQTQDS